MLTESKLTGEPGDADRKETHTGGILRWLLRPSSQLKPVFHGRGRQEAAEYIPERWADMLSTGAAAVFRGHREGLWAEGLSTDLSSTLITSGKATRTPKPLES